MTTLLRWFPALAASCLLSTQIGCGTGNASVPVVSPTPPVSPVPTTKPTFAYTGNQGASISGYSVDASTGALTPLSGFPVAVGKNPIIVTHDRQNRFLMVGDNAAFMLHVYAINPITGALSEVSPSPYNTMIEPGQMIIDPSGTHLYLYRTGANVAFPGVTGNQMFAYNLSSTGVLSAVKGAPFLTGSPGSEFVPATGMAVDTAGKFLYLQDIFNLYTFSIDATSGALSLLQTLPSQYGGGLALDPSGIYLYATGANSLLSYGIDPVTGLLSLAKSTPTAEQNGAYTISLTPSGNFAYTIENNNDLVSYTVSGGVFVPVGSIYTGVYGQQIAVDPSGHFVYVPQGCSNCPSGVYNVIHQFSIAKTGGLARLAPPTVASGITPFAITVISQ